MMINLRSNIMHNAPLNRPVATVLKTTAGDVVFFLLFFSSGPSREPMKAKQALFTLCIFKLCKALQELAGKNIFLAAESLGR